MTEEKPVANENEVILEERMTDWRREMIWRDIIDIIS